MHNPSPEDVKKAFDLQHDLTRSQEHPTCEERIGTLRKLEKILVDDRDAITAALERDFGTRGRGFSEVADIYAPLSIIRHAISDLRQWMARRRVAAGFPLCLYGRAYLQPEPLGTVLVLTPWNFPIFLAFSGIATALAAGNRVILRPSDMTPATSEWLMTVIAAHFDPSLITVFTGDVKVATELTKLPFDKILFTGSVNVGKIVATAAAANLTPCCLELGGKSPAIIGPGADIMAVAARLANSKLLNAGQVCIAADYTFVPRGRGDEFASAANAAIVKYWGATPASNPLYGSIIAQHHVDRISSLVADARKKGATVVELGKSDGPHGGAMKVAPARLGESIGSSAATDTRGSPADTSAASLGESGGSADGARKPRGGRRGKGKQPQLPAEFESTSPDTPGSAAGSRGPTPPRGGRAGASGMLGASAGGAVGEDDGKAGKDTKASAAGGGAAARGGASADRGAAPIQMPGDRRHAPYVVLRATAEMDVMKEEVFGPVLPVLEYDTVDEVIAFINARDKPLALYIFSHDRAFVDRVVHRTSSGGVTVNELALHPLAADLPFGGVGASGIGAYHGVRGFEEFSHMKPIFEMRSFQVMPPLLPMGPIVYGGPDHRKVAVMIEHDIPAVISRVTTVGSAVATLVRLGLLAAGLWTVVHAISKRSGAK